MTRAQAFALSFWREGVMTSPSVCARATKYDRELFIASWERLSAMAGKDPW